LNPVLLTILRNSPFEEFEKDFTDINNIIHNYFNGLLNRERDRQNLFLSENEQYNIMLELAVMMVEFDISSEEPGFIKDMLRDIISLNMPDYINSVCL
jgi:hypothetical protein